VRYPELEGVQHYEADVDGLRMHFAEMGEGPPLVLLHGWPQHWWMWHQVLPTLSRTYRCIAPDLRGLGWTDAPPDGYDKQQLADDVLGLLDELGLDKVRLIGHDWGAVAAQLLCVRAPERVTKCLALSVPSLFDRGLDPRQLLGIFHMPILSAPFAERAVPALAERLLKLGGLPEGEAEPYVEVLREPARRRATVGYYRTFTTRELPRLVRNPPPRPSVPIRVVGGEKDPVCRWGPGVELVRGANHFFPEQKPDAVIGHVHAFLQ
jgi:pimeloyl-ACP methyl ester carboxylesterase